MFDTWCTDYQLFHLPVADVWSGIAQYFSPDVVRHITVIANRFRNSNNLPRTDVKLLLLNYVILCLRGGAPDNFATSRYNKGMAIVGNLLQMAGTIIRETRADTLRMEKLFDSVVQICLQNEQDVESQRRIFCT